jgi:RimJ/RimL family protein N-acetyltransferase
MLMPNQGITNWTWAICLKDSPNQLIGVIELIRDRRPSNRGFWLDRDYRGKNYMAEAAAVVNDYAFNVLGFDKLVFDNAVGNVPSRKIKERTGATFIGIVKARFVDPQITELEQWELTKDAWQAYRSTITPS